jgi:tRNA-specific 2-thiouridylase
VTGGGLSRHLNHPFNAGHCPFDARTGAAGGAACGDLIRVSLRVRDEKVVDCGFDARGCGAATAAGSAATSLAHGSSLVEAARIGADDVARELGGLIPSKRHAAELAADALHRALGAAARDRVAMPAQPDRVLVAMSGGVDSAVAALLSARGGADVVAVTLELWADSENDAGSSCCSAQAVRTARDLAHGMGIPHLTLDLRDSFRAGVVDPFIDDHRAGLTPNPCVRCNGHVRLDAMLELARRLGADALATGHYARVAEDGHGPVLRLAADPVKDQSYMLAAVAPATLARLRFPLGELTKPQVREIAAAAGLGVAGKADSQDLCFLAGTDRARFLERHGGIHERRGELVDRSGRLRGHHAGQEGFTVGQRRGIGIAGPDPLYVLGKDAATNRVTVGTREELSATNVTVVGATLHRAGQAVDRVKLRYRSRPLACHVVDAVAAGRHRRLRLKLAEPVDGAAPGQTACLMAGDLVVGHGTVAPA